VAAYSGKPDGVDFSYSDLRGLHLDGSALVSVRFDRAALEGADNPWDIEFEAQ